MERRASHATSAFTYQDSEYDEDHASHWRNILTKRHVGRNAQFHSLTSEDRERLGGFEYRAIKLLAITIPLYIFLWQFLGSLALGAWISHKMPETATVDGVNPWWAGIFFAVSAFNNCGMALPDLNMIPFQQEYFMLLVTSLLILAGNTAFPLFLRLLFWSLLRFLKFVSPDEAFYDTKSTLEFILKYPRRIYTQLFPSRATWWLLFMLILLNGIDWIAFEVLNIGNPAIESIPVGPRIVDGLFQATGKPSPSRKLRLCIHIHPFTAVRSGGFYVIPISAANNSLQVLYAIMMYISVYPVVITMRHSNVYEERSLGIYADEPAPQENSEEGSLMALQSPTDRSRSVISLALRRTVSVHGVGVHTSPPPAEAEAANDSRISFISQQIRGQLAHDLWWLVMAIFIITTIETSHSRKDPVAFSVFNIIFEVVSAYGTVGISVGLPRYDYSFCGGWQAGSKLVLCLVMLRGRHRGLPVALDRAVRLPGHQLLLDEEEDHRIRISRARPLSAVDNREARSGFISPISPRLAVIPERN
jgi:potassium uptake Trk family protein